MVRSVSGAAFISVLVVCGLHIGRTPGASAGPGGQSPPIGLDLEFSEGRHAPLEVIAGERFSIDSLTIHSSVEGEEDRILELLREDTLFAGLDWSGLRLEREEWLEETRRTLERRQYFHRAAWMGGKHDFSITLLDGSGTVLDGPLRLQTTDAWPAGPDESFATRRFATLVFAHGVTGRGDAASLTSEHDRQNGEATYSGEARLQLRNGIAGDRHFVIPLNARTLRVRWHQLPRVDLEVPLEPVAASRWSYGFQIQVEPSPPARGDRYLPGEEVRFRIRFTDGDGTPLHADGSLPTYEQFIEGQVASGLQYYDFFPGIVFYRDKNREGVLLSALTGPDRSVHQTHEAVPLLEFLFREVQVAATVPEHGFSSLWRMIPPSPVVFGGPASWGEPVSDTVSFTIPPEAPHGNYKFVVKARRVFRGETSLATAIRSIPVGGSTSSERAPKLVGNCDSCHTGAFDLQGMLHSNGDVSTCTSCHFPLEFETDNLLAYRAHRIHFLSDRYAENRRDCTVCHIDASPDVVEVARWLVCTGCHDPAQTHDGEALNGPLLSCATAGCHDPAAPDRHILQQ